MMTETTIISSIHTLKSIFQSNGAITVDARIALLKKLKHAIIDNESFISEALNKDLGKAHQESFFTEIGIVLNEIDLFCAHLKKWTKPRNVSTPLFAKPSSSYIRYEPHGVCLIVSPFNYPFQLTFMPLIGAIGGGNFACIKLSEHTPHVNAITSKIIQTCFNQDMVFCLDGDAAIGELLVQQDFDFIFFTGSTTVGRKIMQVAAEKLIPVVLELGGKSPAIVDASADISLAARRILWGKSINAGQTCIAPDYVLVHSDIEIEFLEQLKKCSHELYSSNPIKSEFYGKIIHKKAYDRLLSMLSEGTIFHGGEYDDDSLKIATTILTSLSPHAKCLNEEIFGPILPVIPFKNFAELETLVIDKSPLALYVFGDNRFCQSMLDKFPSGGACINDTLMHISNPNLPFGGKGTSGLGRYHGKYSFDAFTYQRSVMYSANWIDLKFRYPPFPIYNWIKRLFRF